MYRSRFIATTIIVLMVAIFSIDFGQASFATESESKSPVITTKIDGMILETATPNHVALPATIVFTADTPMTIYYTTNGSDPTTSSTYSTITSANDTATGPTIESTEYMLLTQGVDDTGRRTALMPYIFVAP